MQQYDDIEQLSFLSNYLKLHNLQDEKCEDQVGSSKFYVTPPPQSHSPEEFATFVGESTFYDQYEHFTDIDWAANETVYDGEEEGGEEGGGFKSLEVFHLWNLCPL